MGIRGIALAVAAVLALRSMSGEAEAPAASPPPAEGSESGSGRASANLATYLSDADYPDEAILRHEQGTVGFRLDVDAEGKVSGCAVTQSSGSAALDAATCRILSERARFTPARDAAGKAVPDTVSNRIRWVLPEAESRPDSETARFQAAYELWMNCALGASSKLVMSRLTTREVIAKAMAQCSDVEQLAQNQVRSEIQLVFPRNSIREAVARKLGEARRALSVTQRQ